MNAFYNEHDHFAAAWLRSLISSGQLPSGDVDKRDIQQVQSDGLDQYTECHFFAGIGGWPLALRLAGWPTDRPVWTGSCPCQPFSAAGKKKGKSDERHLWPEFLRLIADRRPATVFGEQVASRLGREWLSGVRVDLEALGYAVGAADLCAAGEGSPHIRQRLFWVADLPNVGRRQGNSLKPRVDCGIRKEGHRCGFADDCGISGKSAHVGHPANVCGERLEERPEQPTRQECASVERGGTTEWVEHPVSSGCDRWPFDAGRGTEQGITVGRRSESVRFWDESTAIHCTDGKTRRIEPGSFPLAHGVPARVGRLRGYGNAIVPQVAATFIRAFLDATADH